MKTNQQDHAVSVPTNWEYHKWMQKHLTATGETCCELYLKQSNYVQYKQACWSTKATS